ncbi:NTP transferase domain-containing protein [Sphingomonas sp. MMS24-J13]|uniref:phosphocholine cytidylyltransferase family protein n=1 Tax=Sphingomonas sp. MMS24-J13 TaxID=3238686 RepID=UPI00384DCC47
MKAIILAAGQGTRLLPFTRDHPKCLVPVGGKAILDHQLDALAAAGVEDVLVVGGYLIKRLEQHLSQLPARTRPGLICNPFWSVANSIGSVWTARWHLAGPFLLMNGDTILATDLIGDALRAAQPGVNLVVERATTFALDDMRVAVSDGRISRVGKDLDDAASGHRSLGMIIATGGGGAEYADALDAVICAQGGAQRFHHAVIDHLAVNGQVSAIETGSPTWIEIDRPEDIERWQAR